MKNNVTWNEIKTSVDIESFLKLIGYFHDSCIKELHMWTEHYVGTELSMAISSELDCKVRILIQRQRSNPSAVELLFEQVTKINVTPSPENYASIIYGATMLLENEIFYWADYEHWTLNSSDKDEATWFAGKKLKWRDASDWMGPKLRYGGNSHELA